MSTLLILILVFIVLGIIPVWPHSKGWGYYPSGGVGLLLTIIIVLVLIGRL